MKTAAVLTAAALAFGGCASTTDTGMREPYVKPGLIILTADQAARRGIELQNNTPASAPTGASGTPLDASSATVPPIVKVYALNRQVDAADRELMHEEHVVYRRETAPRWRLDAPAGDKLVIGPRITDGRQDMRPMVDQELSVFLADQRRALEANQNAIKSLFDAVQTLDRRQQQLAARIPAGTEPPPEVPAPASK